MAASTEVVLDLTLHFAGRPWWWRDPAHLGAILAAVRAHDLWLDFRHVGVQAATLAPFVSVDEVVAASAGWQARAYVLHTHPDGELDAAFTGSYLSLGLRGEGLALQLQATGPELAARLATLVDGAVGFVRALHHHFTGVARVGLETYLRANLRYPSVRPPRVQRTWSLGHLLDVFDPVYYDEETVLADDVRRLLAHPLPAGAERIDDTGLTILRWGRDLVDDDAVVQAAARQERFFADALDLPVIAAYNAAGDLLTAPGAAVAHPPLTVHDPESDTGYLALVAGADGAIADAAWAPAAAWARAAALPDGTLLAAVRLIVPSRAAALALHPRATAAGIERVLYADPQGRWWDPHPPGWWQG
jgi:hypothetical protein